MHRFYADPEKSEGDVFVLTPEDTLHAVKVLRMKEDDQAEDPHEAAAASDAVHAADGHDGSDAGIVHCFHLLDR